MIFVFSAASVVAPMVAVWGYGENGPTDNRDVRLVVVAIAVLLAVAAITASLIVGRLRSRRGS